MIYNIAIDGPAGAGKSTIAKKLAADLGYVYVDTGAMYRAMAYYFLQNNIAADDEAAISAACPDVNVTIEYKDGAQQVILNGENVNGVIRNEARIWLSIHHLRSSRCIDIGNNISTQTFSFCHTSRGKSSFRTFFTNKSHDFSIGSGSIIG